MIKKHIRSFLRRFVRLCLKGQSPKEHNANKTYGFRSFSGKSQRKSRKFLFKNKKIAKYGYLTIEKYIDF